jgi:hypothetical protein
MMGYYRKHIEGYNKIAAPLTDLTILDYPDFNEPFILTTDASDYATGAILSQMHRGKQVVIACGGRKLQEAE